MATRKALRPRSKGAGLGALSEIWKHHRDQQNTGDAVHMTLREAILHGVLKAGQPLCEIPLAETFGRSRTPVREAIFKLESEGLASRSARRGLMVAQITREEILEVYAVREMLDGLSARLAALSILPTELDHLVWLNEQIRSAGANGDRRGLINLNIEFHEALCQASRNSLLQEFMRRIHEWVRRFEDTTMSVPGRADEACDEHEALLEAIRARNPDRAEQLAREHMNRARRIRIGMIQSANSTEADASRSRTREYAAV
jgi:DNA-binding GntR family transcriptional regulator